MCLRFLDLLSIWNLGMFFFSQGEKNTGAPGEKPLGERQRKLESHIASTPGPRTL